MNWDKLLSNNRIKRSKIKDIRNEFESDYGRIIYSPALRRMHDKTQVFPLTTDDNIHSRLTHSTEVMSLGYTLGLKLSKSLAIQTRTKKSEVELLRILPVLLQNVCLIHDIGNAPFGHFGETIVSDYFKNLETQHQPNFTALSERMKRDFFNYDGNAQGLRVLTKLQFLDNPFGLNLTYATLASYLKYPNSKKINRELKAELKKEGKILEKPLIERSKHGVFYSEEKYFFLIVEESGLKQGKLIVRHPLCYLMEAADSIAYLCMDMEDGFNKKLFDINYISECFKSNASSLAKGIIEICKDDLINDTTKIVNIRINLIGYLVELAYSNFEKNLDRIEKGTYNRELIKEDENNIYEIIEKFSIDKIFTSREINYLESTGHSVFKGLLDFYIDFIFNENEKYVKRAKSLISQSIIDAAIDENLIELCETKLKKERLELDKELKVFKEHADHLSKLEKKSSKLDIRSTTFESLKQSYLELFNKQFSDVLLEDEIRNLKLYRKEIYSLLKPNFEDLDDYYKFRVILDFISGMTDQYALDHYQKISGQRIN